MKDEMDAMNMDERQRNSWLTANRVTLLFVGLVWIGMIIWEMVVEKHTPVFLMTMVPIFAAVRFAVYKYSNRTG